MCKHLGKQCVLFVKNLKILRRGQTSTTSSKSAAYSKTGNFAAKPRVKLGSDDESLLFFLLSRLR